MLDEISECFHMWEFKIVNEPHGLQIMLTNVSNSADFDVCSN